MPSASGSGSDIDSNGYQRVYPARPNSTPNVKGHTVRFLGGLRKGRKGRSPALSTRHTVGERGRGRERATERRSASSENHRPSPSLLLDFALPISLAAFGVVTAAFASGCKKGRGKREQNIKNTEHRDGQSSRAGGHRKEEQAMGGRCVTC